MKEEPYCVMCGAPRTAPMPTDLTYNHEDGFADSEFRSKHWGDDNNDHPFSHPDAIYMFAYYKTLFKGGMMLGRWSVPQSAEDKYDKNHEMYKLGVADAQGDIAANKRSML